MHTMIFVLVLSFHLLMIQAKDGVKSNESTEEQTYTTKFDDVNLNEILGSDRLLLNYVNCLLELGHCTPDGLELKVNLPDAIQNDCRKCSEKQKIGSTEVMHYIIDNKPEWWDQLEKKYDPEGTYKKSYLDEKCQDDDNED